MASSRLTASLASVVGSRVASGLFLLALALLAFVPGLSAIQAVDREEARYAVVTQNMIATGDFLTAETDIGPIGPVALGAHWLQAAVVALGGEGAFAAIGMHRLPSLALGVLAVFLLWWAARSFGDPSAAFLAAALFSVTLLVALAARGASPDALILVLVVLGQGALARALTADSSTPDLRAAVAFWTAAALGVLTAGLLVPAVLATSALILSAERRSTRWLGVLAPFPGLLLFVLFLLAWAAILWLDQGPQEAAIGILGRVESFAPGGFPAALPPGTHLLFGALSAFPILILVLLSLSWVFDRLRRPAVVFSLAWAVPVWVAAELAGDKAPTQVLAALPALALLAGAALAEGALGRTGLFRTAVASSLVTVPLGLLVAVGAIGVAFGVHLPPLGILVQLAAVAVGATAFLLWRRGASGVSVGLTAGASSLLTIIAFVAVLAPGFGGLRLSERVLAVARANVSCADPQIVAGGYREPSLAFLAGPATRAGGGSESADLLAANPCAVAIVERGAVDAFDERAADLGLAISAVGEVDGINVGNGRATRLTVYIRSEPPPAPRP